MLVGEGREHPGEYAQDENRCADGQNGLVAEAIRVAPPQSAKRYVREVM
jgi:hypothetical protein